MAYSSTSFGKLCIGFIVVAVVSVFGIVLIATAPDPPIDEPQGSPIVLSNHALHEGQVLAITQDLEIGEDDPEDDWQLLGQLFTFYVSEDERIFVVEGPGGPIRVLDREGVFMHTIGRPGAGPGEFRWVSGILFVHAGSETWVIDSGLGRITRFDHEGEMLDTIPLGREGHGVLPEHYLGDSRFLGRKRTRVFSGKSRLSSQYMHYTEEYGLLDEHLEWSSDFITLRGQSFFRSSDEGLFTAMPFDTYPSLQVSPTGRVVVGHPAEGMFSVCDTDGTSLFSFGRDWEPPVVSKSEIDAWLERMRESRYYDMSLVHDVDLPAVKGVFYRQFWINEDDWVWARRMQESEVRHEGVRMEVYDIFDDLGRWVGTARLDIVPWVVRKDHIYVRFPGDSKTGPRIRRYAVRWLIEH